MADTARAFVPAAGRDWLLPIYDPITRLLGFDEARRELVAQAALQPLHHVLDIGCGTGAVSILVKRLHPTVRVTALDPDARALERATRKALRAGVSVQWDRGFSDALPYPDASFDRVLSSMMLHHLNRVEKEGTLREVWRVLKPGGRFHMMDFTGPDPEASRASRRWLHSQRLLRDNGERSVIALMAGAQLSAAEKVSDRRVLLGSVAFYQASRPL